MSWLTRSSNTIPTDVINFSQQLQIRDPLRVLYRREGGANSQESVSSVTPGINIKHTYVYLTITGSARSEAPAPADAGPGTIGSGRANGGQVSEEASRAKEYKLDMLVKLLDDYPLWQAIIHVGTFAMLEAVVVRLPSQGKVQQTLTHSTSSEAGSGTRCTSRPICPHRRRRRSCNAGATRSPVRGLDSWSSSMSTSNHPRSPGRRSSSTLTFPARWRDTRTAWRRLCLLPTGGRARRSTVSFVASYRLPGVMWRC